VGCAGNPRSTGFEKYKSVVVYASMYAISLSTLAVKCRYLRHRVEYCCVPAMVECAASRLLANISEVLVHVAKTSRPKLVVAAVVTAGVWKLPSST
jgi:multidrug transporter EmrE-like cation transporter